MSKINEFRSSVFEKLAKKYSKRISIVEIGDFRRNKKPWFHTMVTDSDEGPLVIFLISIGCYENEYKDVIKKAIIDSIYKHCGFSDSDKGQLKDKPKKSKAIKIDDKPQKDLKVSQNKNKRGRPPGSKNKKRS